MHTNDLHSHLLGTGPDNRFTPQVGDGDPVRGHFGRLATVMREIASQAQTAGEPCLIFDSGDSYCGTLFQLLGPATATTRLPEYEFFTDLGYTALGLGNHEFEAGESGLNVMLGKMRRYKPMVPIVATNLILGRSAGVLRAHWNPDANPASGGVLMPYLIHACQVGTQTLHVGILGALGPDAAKLSLANRSEAHFVGFDDDAGKADLGALVAFLQERVSRLREQHQVDLVILLLHGGREEETAIAQGVTGIDLILAGHTHETYVRQEGKTWISQSGWRGENLNVLALSREPSGLNLRHAETAVRAVDDTIVAATDQMAKFREYESTLDQMIHPSGYSVLEPVCLIDRERRRERWPNNQAGMLVVDALKTGVNARLIKPVHVYVSSYAMIRSDFLTPGGVPTVYQFSDIFRFSPLGHDPGGRGGAPVTVFHLTPKEVHLVLEAMHWFSRHTPAYEPVVSSGLTYELSMWGVPLVNRVHSLKLDGVPFESWPPLIRVAANEFLTRNLLRIRSISGGMVDVSLRDEEGRPVTSLPSLALPPEHEILAHQLRQQFPIPASGPISLPASLTIPMR